MQRNVVLPIVGGVVAALILVGAILLIGHRHKTAEVAITTPLPSESALVTTEPTTPPSPTASAATSASPGPSASAAASTAPNHTPAPTAKPTPTPHPVRSVSSVNCNSPSDAQYCSKKDEAVYANNKVTTPPANPSPPTYPNAATISMQSSATDGNVHVVVTVENKTSKTFHFPKREVDLVITKDGKAFDTLVTNGAAFDMTPGTKMTATFDRPISSDGTYSWQAKTWYYVK